MKLPLALVTAVLPGVLKVQVYRRFGMRLGRNVRIGFGTVLLCKDVDLDDGARIGVFCLIRAQSLRMGKRATIANLVRVAVHSLLMKSQSTISSQNEIAGDQTDERSSLVLGPATWILPHCHVNVARPIVLGRNVGVGGGSYLFTHGMWLSKLDGFPISYGGIVIHDDVWLPWGCFILPGVTIGSRVVVGARSVVNKSLPEGVLAAGVPAKVLREKSYVDLSPADRTQVIVEISEAFGRKHGVTVSVERSDVADVHYVNGLRFLVLHKVADGSLDMPPTLNVVFSPLDRDDARRILVWSLHDYQSSPYPDLPTSVRDWFSSARVVGVRYYPVDEDFA